MRLPNFEKTRFCRQNWEMHGNAGGREMVAKKPFEYLLFEKIRLPNFQKARFCRLNWENFQKSEMSGAGDEKTIWISSIRKNAIAHPKKARFCRQHCKIHGNLLEKMRFPNLGIWEVRNRGRKNNLKIFYLKQDAAHEPECSHVC